MKAGRASKTAEVVAAVRARHTLYDEPKVFDDPWAVSLTSPVWRFICRNRLLTWLVFDVVYRKVRSTQATLLARARFVEETLRVAIARGDVDYVIVGAGFDSFALRQTESARLRYVWEIDHPDTQTCKQRRLSDLGVVVPANVRFIPVDLGKASLTPLLEQHGFHPSGIAFVSMLGLSYYLPRSILLGLIETIATTFPAGSELVIDIRVDARFLSGDDLSAFRRLERATARRDEVMTTHFHPDDFTEACAALGMHRVECLSPAQQTARYFAGRNDGWAASPEVYLLHLRVA